MIAHTFQEATDPLWTEEGVGVGDDGCEQPM
jgi:hypothetical protein